MRFITDTDRETDNKVKHEQKYKPYRNKGPIYTEPLNVSETDAIMKMTN